MGRSNSFRYSFRRNVRFWSLIMGINRADAYYEPDDYDDRSDEIEERTWQLLKVGGKFDYRTSGAISEALSEMGVDDCLLYTSPSPRDS